MPSTMAFRVLEVLGMKLLRTSKHFEKTKTDKTFYDEKWMLTITRVAPKCWDTVGPARLCHDTLADEHTYRGDKGVHEEKVLGTEVP
jgi:hypothetical protein